MNGGIKNSEDLLKDLLKGGSKDGKTQQQAEDGKLLDHRKKQLLWDIKLESIG